MDLIKYDLPEYTPGICFIICPLLETNEKGKWSISSRLIKHFCIDDFESGNFNCAEEVDSNNLHVMPEFSLYSEKENRHKIQGQVLDLLNRFKEKNSEILNKRIKAIIMGIQPTQLIYYNGK